MGFSQILAEFAGKMWLAENPPEKNTASRKSAEKVGQPAEYNEKIRLVSLLSHTRTSCLNTEAEPTTLAEESTTQLTDLKLNLPWWPHVRSGVVAGEGSRVSNGRQVQHPGE